MSRAIADQTLRVKTVDYDCYSEGDPVFGTIGASPGIKETLRLPVDYGELLQKSGMKFN